MTLKSVDLWVCRWNPSLPGKEWKKRGAAQAYPVGSLPGFNGEPPPDPVVPPSLYAGHIPNRVLVGFSAPDDNNNNWAFPGWSGARSIVGRNVYVHRDFTSSTSPSQWYSWVVSAHLDNYTRQAGQPLYPLLSVKVASYTTCTSGGYDVDGWGPIREWAKTRRTSGPSGTPQPFALTAEHEPDGNPGGTLTEWGRMERSRSNYMAGWAVDPVTGAKIPGSYNPANDVTDIVAWHCIPNGHWFGPKNRQQTKIDAALPDGLISDFNENRAVISPDIYDPSPPNKDNANDPNRDTPPFNYAADADRTHKKAQAFFDWARSKGVKAVGFGEFSATEADEIRRVWAVVRANRDICGWISHFSSPQNSRWPWRLILASYPGGQHPDVYKNGVLSLKDFGGSAMSEARLVAFREMVDESISATYTSPIGG